MTVIRRIYVIAGTWGEFMGWCHDNDISRNDPRVRFVSDFSKLYGVPDIEESKGDKVVLYGTYRARYDWPEMAEVLATRWRD
ncbi:MAG TPA: hypothetical protein VFI41_05095 [Gemmatimonadales bacterium]|nr:hypothetical protein [Gemmatimonadales bacterium]